MVLVRISTSPPSNYDFDAENEASYYCDLYKTEEWSELDIIRNYKYIDVYPGLSKIEAVMIVAQSQFNGNRKEIGVLLQFTNDDGELMYYGVDHHGNGRSESAANEAAWHIANAGETLDANYRLKRSSGKK